MNPTFSIFQTLKKQAKLIDGNRKWGLWGDRDFEGHNRGFCDAGHVLLLDRGGGYRSLFTLRRFIKLYNYDLHTSLFACYF